MQVLGCEIPLWDETNEPDIIHQSEGRQGTSVYLCIMQSAAKSEHI